MQPHVIHASSQALDNVARIAVVLRDRYGADAVFVARRQIEVADGDNRVTWQAILDRLST